MIIWLLVGLMAVAQCVLFYFAVVETARFRGARAKVESQRLGACDSSPEPTQSVGAT